MSPMDKELPPLPPSYDSVYDSGLAANSDELPDSSL